MRPPKPQRAGEEVYLSAGRLPEISTPLVPSSKRWKLPSWAPQVFGYLLSAGCLIWVLRGYPLSDLISTIRSLDFRWVLFAVLADLSAYLVHAWRWNTLLAPVARLRFWRTAQAIYIGLFANEVLPLRTGELIRCYLLAHWNNLRISLIFASAAVERLIDGFWMLGCFLITASVVRGIPGDVVILVQILGVFMAALAVGLAWIVLRKHEASAAVRESRWASTLRHVIEGLHLMGNRRTLGTTSLISLVYLVVQFVSVWALMKAYGLDLSFWAGAGVLTIVRLLTVIPNAPGNVGLFQVACVVALGLFDVEKNDAKTFSFIMFFAMTVPLLVGGAIAVALTGLNIAELRDRARQGIQSVHRGPSTERP